MEESKGSRLYAAECGSHLLICVYSRKNLARCCCVVCLPFPGVPYLAAGTVAVSTEEQPGCFSPCSYRHVPVSIELKSLEQQSSEQL